MDINTERLQMESTKYKVEFCKWFVNADRYTNEKSSWQRRAERVNMDDLLEKDIPGYYIEIFRELPKVCRTPVQVINTNMNQIVPERNEMAHGPTSRFAYLLERYGSQEQQNYWGRLFEIKESQTLETLAESYRAFLCMQIK